MTDAPLAIAQVALARDLRRALVVPLILVAGVVASVGVALLLGGGSMLPLMVVILASVVAIVAVALVIVPATARLEVEVGALRVRWLGGSREHLLVPGPVTRVRLTGEEGRALRARLGILGWSLGRAVLGGEERIWLVRLGPAERVILVPTDTGRLGIAPASETELIEALTAAARVQQRLDEVGGRVRAAFAPPVAAPPAMKEEPPVPADAAAAAFLTGIERARLEERLAAAREVALRAAEAERRAKEEAEAAALGAGTPAVEPVGRRAKPRPSRGPNLARQRVRGTWTRPGWATDPVLRQLATIGWALLPLVASVVAWAFANGGSGPASSATLAADGRLLSLLLVLCGPAAALGVVASRAWWPRLTGLVAVAALCGAALTVRAVTG